MRERADGQPEGRTERRPEGRTERRPGLSQLRPRTWIGVLARSVKGFQQDNCADLAASLTYYALLSVFPAAIVVAPP